MNKPIIYNKDIKEISKKAESGVSISQDEEYLLRLENAVETRIQQDCVNIFNEKMGNMGKPFSSAKIFTKAGKSKIKKVRNLLAIIKALFVQIDNGSSSAKDSSRRRKAAEGTISGFPDCMLLNNGKIVFVEFKRIGSFNISEEQQFWNDWLNENGFKAYITNNPLFFRDVILKELKL